jgi:integrase
MIPETCPLLECAGPGNWFRLLSVFALAMSEGVVDRNPAAALFTGTPRKVIVRPGTWEGMRPGEILALQLADLDDDSVWVRRRMALTVGTLALLDQWKLRLLGSPPETWIFGSEKERR